jgi:hypothetical protein
LHNIKEKTKQNNSNVWKKEYLVKAPTIQKPIIQVETVIITKKKKKKYKSNIHIDIFNNSYP